MSDIKAILFDVDGTLADTERDGHRVAFNLAFKEMGLDWEWDVELYEKLLEVTGGKERTQFFIELKNPTLPDLGEQSLADWIATIHKTKTKHYLQLLEQGAIPLRVGVKRILDEAREKGLRLAVATTTTLSNVTTLLEHTLGKESLEWFEVIAAGDIVPSKKPAPDIYNYVLEKMHLTPEQCIALEDSENGIKSSLGANIPTVITINGYTKHQDFSGALLVLDQLGDKGDKANKIAGTVDFSDNYLTVDFLMNL